MKNPFSSKDLPEPLRRRIELGIAVAQERLLATHVRHALELIKLVGDQVPFENALGIYTRMLRLGDDQARVITTRALATLGQEVEATNEWPDLVAEAPVEDQEGGPGQAFFRAMRQRLRGRVHDDLRRWVELAAARTEVAVLDTHVENSLHFVGMLEGEMPIAEAVELYLDALNVRDSIAEVTYYITLSRLADRQLPAGPRGLEQQREPRLQVVEKDRA